MKKKLLITLLFLSMINLSTKADIILASFEISNGSILYDKLPAVAGIATPFTASFSCIGDNSPRKSVDFVIFHRGIDGTNTPLGDPINVQEGGVGSIKVYQRTVNLILPAGFTSGKIMIKFRYRDETAEYYSNYSFPVFSIPSPNMMPLMRMSNPDAGRHMITASVKEKRDLMKVGWQYEGEYGLVKIVQESPYIPLYRFYRLIADDHVFQAGNSTAPPGYDGEGIAGYVLPSSGNDTKPVYTYYNGKSGDRLYTSNAGELSGVRDWQFEGIAFYVQ